MRWFISERERLIYRPHRCPLCRRYLFGLDCLQSVVTITYGFNTNRFWVMCEPCAKIATPLADLAGKKFLWFRRWKIGVYDRNFHFICPWFGVQMDDAGYDACQNRLGTRRSLLFCWKPNPDLDEYSRLFLRSWSRSAEVPNEATFFNPNGNPRVPHPALRDCDYVTESR